MQVGLDPPARVLAPRRPDVLALLDALGGGATRPLPTTPLATAVLRDLDEAGLLQPAPLPRARTGHVALVDRGLGLDPLRSLLEQEGIAVTSDGARHGAAPPVDVVVASLGPVPRAELDPLVAEGAPHLVLAGTGRPGSPAPGPARRARRHGLPALRRRRPRPSTTRDAPLVVEQLATLPPGPVEAAVVALGLAWAAREVAAFVRHRPPVTWSATIDLDAPAPVVRPVLRHPLLRLRLGRPALLSARRHQNSASSLPSIERRCSREQASQ